MRNYIITLFSLIVASSCCNDNDVVDNEARYIPNFGNPEMKEIIGYGPIKKCTEYFFFDNISEEYGNVILGRPDFYYAYIFSPDGNIVESDFNGFGRHTYEYLERTCIYNCYDDNKKLSERIVNSYNNNKQITKQEIYNEYRKLSQLYTYKYNKQGDMVEKVDSLSNTIYHSNVFHYDEKQRVIKKEYDNSCEEYMYHGDTIIVYTYDGSCNIKRKEFICDDIIIDSLFSKGYIDQVLVYDSKKNIIEEQSWNVYNGQNYQYLNTTYKYIFDAKGNWIKKERYLTNKEIPSSIVMREIEYY